MAATDVKDIFVQQLENGEQWLYKRLCNGTEVAIARICNCAGNPDDPGNIPDPVDATACRVANGLTERFLESAVFFAAKLMEQPDNAVGSVGAGTAWQLNTYGQIMLSLWGQTLTLATNYNNPDEEQLHDDLPLTVEYVVCAAYTAIIADEAGVSLNPEFIDAFKVVLTEAEVDPPDVTISAAITFLINYIDIITLEKFRQWAFEASGEEGLSDLDCAECGSDPESGLCVEEAYTWNTVNATPDGWSTMTTLPAADFGNLQDEFEACPSFAASRTAFGDWVRTGTSAGVQCMGIRRVFAVPCLVTSVSCEFMADTGNSKHLAIAANVDGTWTVLTSLFDQAPSANPRAIQAQGEWADVSEIVFIHRNGNTTTDIHPRITKTNINILG